RAELLRRMSKSDQELISELTKQKDELTKMKDELLKQKADLQNTKTTLQSDKKKLDSEYNESTQTQAQLKAQQRKYLEIQEKNKAEIKKIDKMIDDLISQSEDPNAPTSGFKWPVPGKSRISSPFGWRKLNGVDDFHLGIDIPGPTGTDIVAAQSGRVIIVVPASSSYGKYVVIDHGGGYSTLYAHTSATNVSVGQTVIKGQKIADIGNTGNSYGSHLHFEVRINGDRKNPSLYVKP
ncbi:MAG: peptidoglycan DD-metalloendopeptidase family protein, partial [Oscillospiraceae bacterium]